MSNTMRGSLETAVLVAVARLGSEAYGVPVRDAVSETLGHDYSVGAIYTSLQRLEEKGLLSATVGEPLPQRGGRARRTFHVTAAGHRALESARRASASLWAIHSTTPVTS